MKIRLFHKTVLFPVICYRNLRKIWQAPAILADISSKRGRGGCNTINLSLWNRNSIQNSNTDELSGSNIPMIGTDFI